MAREALNMQGRIQPLTLPKWGLSMTEGTLVNWRVASGDALVPGMVIADIESSKIVNELAAHEAGVFRRRVLEEGATCECGTLIGIATEGDVSEAAIDAYVAAFRRGSGEALAPPQQTPAELPRAANSGIAPLAAPTMPASVQLNGEQRPVPATDHALALARRWNLDLSRIRPTGGRGRVTKADLLAAVAAAGGAADPLQARAAALQVPPRDPQRPATPVARRVAAKLGIALASVSPQPGARRIRKADVLAAKTNVPGPAPMAAPIVLPSGAVAGEYEERALSSMRRVIGQRLAQSKQVAPHFRLVIDVPMDALLELREGIRTSRGIKISLNDLLIKAVAHALVAVPEVNIHVQPDRVRYFKDAHVAVAVALDNGLMTPVVRFANRKGLLEIAAEMQALSAKAREGHLVAEQIEGGTFSLSNLGMYGVRQFDAIINPPQGAILAVGALQRQRVYGDDGSERVATLLTATLACDHRAIDGALGARFLQTLRGFIANPATMLS